MGTRVGQSVLPTPCHVDAEAGGTLLSGGVDLEHQRRWLWAPQESLACSRVEARLQARGLDGLQQRLVSVTFPGTGLAELARRR